MHHCGTTEKYLDFAPEAEKFSLDNTDQKFQVEMQQFTQLQLHIQKYAKHIQNAELQNTLV